MSTKKAESDSQALEDYVQPMGTLPAGSSPDDREFFSVIAEKRERMRQHLASQPKVTRFIPNVPGDTRPVPVQLNGLKLLVPRNQQVEVAVDVAAILDAADIWGLEAHKEMLLVAGGRAGSEE